MRSAMRRTLLFSSRDLGCDTRNIGLDFVDRGSDGSGCRCTTVSTRRPPRLVHSVRGIVVGDRLIQYHLERQRLSHLPTRNIGLEGIQRGLRIIQYAITVGVEG